MELIDFNFKIGYHDFCPTFINLTESVISALSNTQFILIYMMGL